MTARRRYPRSARLLQPAQFDAAFAGGKRYPAKLLAMVVAANNEVGARLGLTVPKKVAPRACDRNRLKRHIRESFRNHRHRLPAVDIVVSARPGAQRASAPEVRQHLEQMWNRILQSCATP